MLLPVIHNIINSTETIPQNHKSLRVTIMLNIRKLNTTKIYTCVINILIILIDKNMSRICSFYIKYNIQVQSRTFLSRYIPFLYIPNLCEYKHKET